LKTGDVRIDSHDGGSFSAYLAVPQGAKRPGLILGQYICGVNKVMRTLADRFASQGYLTLVPDLFWRQEPGVQLVNDPSRPDPAEFKRALALNAGFDDTLAVHDLLSSLAFLRGHAQCSEKAGFLGYCLGGRLAYYMATRSDADCAVSYYGVNIHEHLDEAASIRRPLLMHLAERDDLVPAAARAAIVERLEGHRCVTLCVHAGVNHAFALEGGPNYSQAAAEAANRASMAFLQKHLS
jgi:carboxymethylenebutenolidase